MEISREVSIFSVESNLNPISIHGINRIKKNQDKINFNSKTSCLITVSDSNIRNYIRYGLNQNNGKPQTDIFIVDKNGKIDKSSPIIWDFKNITEIVLFCTRGTKVRTLKSGRTQVNMIRTKKREHSRKPDELYKIIEKCSWGPYLELFARGTRKKWTSWGNQSKKYKISWKTYKLNSQKIS